MKKTFAFLILIFLLSCSSQEVPVEVTKIDTSKVTYKDTVAPTDSSALSIESEITCPKCKFKKKEIMPTDRCLLKYTCTNCKEVLYPDEKDCCVFCTYGTHKCPSKQ